MGRESEPQLKFPKPVKKEKKKRGFSSIKRRNNFSLDDALADSFSLLVKCEAGWRCSYSGCTSGKFNAHPDIAFEDNSIFNGYYDFLDCSHFFRRSDQGTSHSLENADSFCRRHHTNLEKLKKEGQEYYELKKNQLGEEAFEELRKKSVSIVKTYDIEKKEIVLRFLDRIQELGYSIDKLKFKYMEALK